jgi:hypothetical protein
LKSSKAIHLASIHATAGERNKAFQVRSRIKNRGLLNLPGCSTIITLNGVAHEFFSGAKPHLHVREMYAMSDLCASKVCFWKQMYAMKMSSAKDIILVFYTIWMSKSREMKITKM